LNQNLALLLKDFLYVDVREPVKPVFFDKLAMIFGLQ